MKTNDRNQVELKKIYRYSAPSLPTVKYWSAKFKRSCTSIFVEDRQGRPTEVTTSERIDKIHDILINYLKMSEIGEIVGISIDYV